jgi:hypothetical protein
MGETPCSHEERISNLETEVAELRRHSHQMNVKIVHMLTLLARLGGVPEEKINATLDEENAKIISKLHGNN